MKENTTYKLKGRIGAKLKKWEAVFLAMIMVFTVVGSFGGMTSQAAYMEPARISSSTYGAPDVANQLTFDPTSATVTLGTDVIARSYSNLTMGQKTNTDGTMYLIKFNENDSSHHYGGSTGSIMTIEQKHAGRINGQYINLKISIDEMTMVKDVAWGSDLQYFGFAALRDDGVFCTQSAYVIDSNNTIQMCSSVGGFYTADIDYTVSITYDDGSTVDLPFYQIAADIDIHRYSDEGITFHDNYNRFFVYDTNELQWEADGEGMLFQTTHSDESGNVEGDDSYFIGGVIGTMDKGIWTCTAHQPGLTYSEIQSFSEYINIDDPEKTVVGDEEYYIPGGNVDFAVTQRMGDFYVDTYSVYSGLIFTDNLPEGLTYKNGTVKMYSGNDDITDQGTVNYDSESRTLQFVFDSDWVSSQANYNGQTLKMTFTATIDDTFNGDELTNSAFTTISGLEYGPVTTTIEVESPKLSITKDAEYGPYNIGDTIEYTIQVSETEEGGTAENVVVTDTVPSDLSLISVTPNNHDGTATTSGNSFTVNYDSLSYGETATITVKVTALQTGNGIINTAYAKADNAPEVDSSAYVGVIEPETAKAGLYIYKDADYGPYYVGDTVEFVIMVGETEKGATAENVVVRDKVPGSLELVSVNADNYGGVVAIDGNSFTVSYDSLSYGEDATITVTATAQRTGNEIINTAYAKADEISEINDSADVAVIEPEVIAPELSITKDADYGPYNIGDDIEYTIKVTETEKDATAENVVVRDKVPGSLELISVTADDHNGKATIDGNSFTVNYASLAYNETATITVTVKALQAGSEIINTAYAKADNVSEVSDDADIGIISPKLSITKDADYGPYSVGDTVEYTINVNETVSGATANNVVVSDTLPGNLELVSVTADSPKGTVSTDGNSFTVKYDSISYGTTAEITVKATALYAGSEIINTAYAEADSTDRVSDTADISVIEPKLAITKTAAPGPYQIGDELTYEISVTQTEANATAKNVVVTDTVPDEVELETVTTTKGSGSKSGNSFTVNCGDLAYGETATITVTVKALAEGDSIPNTAYADADNALEVSDGADIVVAEPILKISKEADKEQYFVGDTVTYTITVKQSNPNIDARGVVVKDTLPDGLELVSVKATTVYDGSVDCDITKDGNSFEADINKLSSSDYVTITVTATATSEAANKSLKNTATATGTNVSTPVEDDETVDVLQPALSISKDADATEYGMDDTVTYTIQVQQTEEGLTAENVVVSDTLPDELKLESVTADGGSVKTSGNGFTVTYKSLAYGETAEITVKATALTDKEDVVNTAYASADHVDEVNDDSTITILRPSLSIKKDADKTVYSQLDTVTYTIDVEQTVAGLTAKNVVVSDALPSELKLISVTADDPEGTVKTKDNGFTVSYDKLPYGTTAHIVVTAKAESEGEVINNTATATATYVEEVEDDVDIRVDRPDINIVKDVDQKTFYPGDTATYTLTVTNEKEAPNAYNVVVTDTLPDGLTLQDVSADGETSIDGNSFTVVYDTIPYGESRTITVKAYVEESAANTTLENIGEVTADNADPKEDYADIDVIKPEIDIEKIADKETYSIGEEVDYTISVKQVIEGLTAENVVVTDELPDEMLLKDAVVSGVDGAIDIDGNGFTANIPALGYGETATITVTAEAVAENDSVTNTVYATADHADPKDDDVTVGVIQPDISITKDVDKHDHYSGDKVIYTITVKETVEGAEAFDVMVFDDLPEGVELEGVETVGKIGEVTIDGNGFTVVYDSLGYEDEAVITVTATALDSESNAYLDNVAKVTAINIPDEKEDDAEIEVMEPELTIEKDADKETYYAGEDLIYTITVRQIVEDAFEENVVITDEIPDGLTIRNVELDGVEGRVSQVGQNLTIEIPRLEYGEDAVVTVRAEVGNELTDKTVTNTAYVEGDHTPQISDDVDVDVVKPVLEITKVADKTTYDAHDTVTYTITVKQTVEGLTDTNVVVKDTLPDEVGIADTPVMTGVEGTVALSGNGFVANIPELAYGDTATITVQATAEASLQGGSATNVAYAQGDYTDEVNDSAKITVNPAPADDPDIVNGTNGANGADSTGEDASKVQTGDNYIMYILLAVAAVLLIGGCVLVIHRRRN